MREWRRRVGKGLGALLTLAALGPGPLVAQSADAGPPAAPAARKAAQRAAMDLDPYPLERAWHERDPGAIALLQELEATGGFRGKARSEHRAVLLGLLRQVGDSTFAVGLAAQWPQQHAAVLGSLRQAAGADSATLAASNPRSFGPRRPGEPPVETCAARIDALARADTLSRAITRIERLPGGEPIPVAAGAPDRVSLSVWIGATGIPLLSRVRLSYPADSAALAAARRAFSTWRFTPAEAAGCGIPNLYEVRLRP